MVLCPTGGQVVAALVTNARHSRPASRPIAASEPPGHRDCPCPWCPRTSSDGTRELPSSDLAERTLGTPCRCRCRDGSRHLEGRVYGLADALLARPDPLWLKVRGRIGFAISKPPVVRSSADHEWGREPRRAGREGRKRLCPNDSRCRAPLERVLRSASAAHIDVDGLVGDRCDEVVARSRHTGVGARETSGRGAQRRPCAGLTARCRCDSR